MSKFLFFILLSFTLMGCSDKKPKKPPQAANPNPWANDDRDRDRNNQSCSYDQVKDLGTGLCAAKCNSGLAPTHGNCTQTCAGGVLAGPDGRCPPLGAHNGCAGQVAVQNTGPRLLDGNGRVYYQAQNSTGAQVYAYECSAADMNCQQKISLGQICTQIDSNGNCLTFDTRYNSQVNTAGSGFTPGMNNAQSYQTTNASGQTIYAYQCQPSDASCLQNESAGNVCVDLDTNRNCNRYDRLGQGAVRYGGTTGGGGVANHCVGGITNYDMNTSVQSCYPAGTVLNQPGFSNAFGNAQLRIGMGQQGFAGNFGQTQGGQFYDPRAQIKGGLQQGSPAQMFQNNSNLGVQAQFNAINNDPSWQTQISGNQYPIMFSTSSAPHCQNYNRWLYQNMIVTAGADPCAYVYNAVSALVCAGKMIVQRIRPGINTVFEGHLDRVRQAPATQTYTQPTQQPGAQTPIQSSPVPSGSGTASKGGPPPLPPLPGNEPGPSQPVPNQPVPNQPVPPQPTGPVAKGQPPTVGQTVTKTKSSGNKNCCVSRVCKIGGSFILSDRDQSCNGVTVEAVVSTQPATSPADFPPNAGETTINAQVIKDKDGTLKLQFFAIGPGEQIEITHFKYSSSQPVDLASTGPVLFADVTWKTRTGFTCSVTNQSFSAVIYAQPKPIPGATCSKGGA